MNENNINFIKNHPPYSPDFNAIEFIWKILKDNVESKTPKNINELEEAIKNSWDQITLSQINNCIDHINKNIPVLVCIKNNGKLVSYFMTFCTIDNL